MISSKNFETVHLFFEFLNNLIKQFHHRYRLTSIQLSFPPSSPSSTFFSPGRGEYNTLQVYAAAVICIDIVSIYSGRQQTTIKVENGKIKTRIRKHTSAVYWILVVERRTVRTNMTLVCTHLNTLHAKTSACAIITIVE